MKNNPPVSLRTCAIASALLLSGAAHAQFSTDGYFRSGTGAGTKDNSGSASPSAATVSSTAWAMNATPTSKST